MSNNITKQKKTSYWEILKFMKIWLDKADSETLTRVFNSEFNGNLIYIPGEKKYGIDSDVAKNLNIITY